jgi:chromosome condensin MukBEF complex kleisin-like MukF subunit
MSENPYTPYKSPYHVVFGEEMMDETQRILNETLYQQLNDHKDNISNIEVKIKKINKRLKEKLDTLSIKSLEIELFYLLKTKQSSTTRKDSNSLPRWTK